MVPDDALDVFIMIVLDSLISIPKRSRPQSLTSYHFLCPSRLLGKDALTMMEDDMRTLHKVDVVLLPIIFNKHFHVVLLDKQKEYE